jgi:phosphodiesterase/alkaline phosphatase D-like protein
MERKHQGHISRRRFLLKATLTGGGIIGTDLLSKSGLAQVSAPAIITSDKMRPKIPYGVASGDITGGNAIIWSRSDRPARMIVEYDTTDSFGQRAACHWASCFGNRVTTQRVLTLQTYQWVSRYSTESPSRI